MARQRLVAGPGWTGLARQWHYAKITFQVPLDPRDPYLEWLAISPTIWLFSIAMENGPFIDGLPVYLLKMLTFHGYVK